MEAMHFEDLRQMRTFKDDRKFRTIDPIPRDARHQYLNFSNMLLLIEFFY